MSSAHHTSARVLTLGGIIAHQTDTVFGFACLPQEPILRRLAAIKQRAPQRGFILLAASIDQLDPYINGRAEELERLTHVASVPTTWLVTAAQNLPPSLLGEHNKIAVRLVCQQTLVALCRQVGPIASTSANISQQDTCADTAQLRTMFGPQIDYIETHAVAGTGQASRIIDCLSQEIIRA